MICSSSRTHRGNIRIINEDSVLCHPEYQLYAIADGMGGHSAGDLASQLIITELLKIYLEENDQVNTLKQIESTLITINEKINSGLINNDENTVVGSTVVIAYIFEDVCSFFWVGDSRLYIYRSKRLYQLTKDHSLIQEMIDSGKLSYIEAKRHPRSNVITRALGVCSELKVDSNQFRIQSGDKLLLCSDGLYKEIDPNIIINSLQKEHTEMIANNLLGEVLIRNAADNVSFIVLAKE